MRSVGIVLLCIGALGLIECGGLWLARRYLRARPESVILDVAMNPAHRHRLELWWRLAPALTVTSAAAAAIGAVLAVSTGRG